MGGKKRNKKPVRKNKSVCVGVQMGNETVVKILFQQTLLGGKRRQGVGGRFGASLLWSSLTVGRENFREIASLSSRLGGRGKSCRERNHGRWSQEKKSRNWFLCLTTTRSKKKISICCWERGGDGRWKRNWGLTSLNSRESGAGGRTNDLSLSAPPPRPPFKCDCETTPSKKEVALAVT